MGRLFFGCLLLLLLLPLISGASLKSDDSKSSIDYSQQIRPLLQKHCYQCHGPEKQKNGLRLDQREAAFKGGDQGTAIVPGKSDKSPLYRYIAGLEPDIIMPPKGPRLSQDEVKLIQQWIDSGAKWPNEESQKTSETWWSLQPIKNVAIPTRTTQGKPWERTPIDWFITEELRKKQLQSSPEADRRTLIRRLKYDLLGLPPTSEEVDAFVTDNDSVAYEKLVDRYLASPHYGERWARHWLDVVHYGETHGYDKDQPRPHAWPYRDYVIRAFNEDKPYSRFVLEQLAGDVLFPGTRDGIEALGFISAGPWDLIGHAELPETKIDGKIARHLDRDDMVANTINTFQSMTVHCAQCHNHKFDPISSEDYYCLQAVFAAIDRADKEYDLDSAVGKKRQLLKETKRKVEQTIQALKEKQKQLSSPQLLQITKELSQIKKEQGNTHAEFGYHSQLTNKANVEKWVQLDLHEPVEIRSIELIGCYDDFNNIGAGFGFPRRYQVTCSSKPDMSDASVIVDRSQALQENPGTVPQQFACQVKARYMRITALELAQRQNDYMFALAEVRVLDHTGANRALKATVSALDSIEAPSRWAKVNLVDGIMPKPIDLGRQQSLQRAYEELHAKLIPDSLRAEIATSERNLSTIQLEISHLPSPQIVYSGTVHSGKGNFVGTGNNGGTPRPIYLLQRGNVQKPGREMTPGTLSVLKHLPGRFTNTTSEGERRVALAQWIVHRDNPLTWRSIVNRVWLYHFGQGLVETPNDFGRMGQLPSHPELLDWLANDFRQHGSFKKLHKLIVTSSVYRQSSKPTINSAKAQSVDSANRLLWKMNRRRLEAEALRDSVLQNAGKLDFSMGGPSYQDYVVEKPEHSPHYRYELKDPDDPKVHRRAIYRSIVRSQQNPWMATMDCADPSILVDKRNQTSSPLQALAMLNDPLLMVMSQHLASRLSKESKPVQTAFRIVLQRSPTADEERNLSAFVKKYGLAPLGRLLWNLNEFAFVD